MHQTSAAAAPLCTFTLHQYLHCALAPCGPCPTHPQVHRLIRVASLWQRKGHLRAVLHGGTRCPLSTKVMLWPAIAYHSMPCRRPAPGQPSGRTGLAAHKANDLFIPKTLLDPPGPPLDTALGHPLFILWWIPYDASAPGGLITSHYGVHFFQFISGGRRRLFSASTWGSCMFMHRRLEILYVCITVQHGRTARSGHGLPKFAPAMLYSSTPCRRATPETALWPFQGWQPAAVFYSFGHPTPFAFAVQVLERAF
jgi:hypothetical protein